MERDIIKIIVAETFNNDDDWFLSQKTEELAFKTDAYRGLLKKLAKADNQIAEMIREAVRTHCVDSAENRFASLMGRI